MNKKEFLKNLETKLQNLKDKDRKEILDYYDELIEDKKEAGLTEKEIIKEISIDEITKEIKLEAKLQTVNKKPTISNGIKGLIAVLSIISLPILAPVVLLVLTLTFTGIILLISILIIIFSLVITSIALIIALFYQMFLGNLPILSFLFGLGITLILIGLFLLLSKWLYLKTSQFIIWTINKLKTFRKRKEVKHE